MKINIEKEGDGYFITGEDVSVFGSGDTPHDAFSDFWKNLISIINNFSLPEDEKMTNTYYKSAMKIFLEIKESLEI